MGLLVEILRDKYNKVLLTIQEVAKELGITKKEVESLIEVGKLSAVITLDKKYVSAVDLADFLGDSAVDSGQHASGYPVESTLYLGYNTESEGLGMAYTGSISSLKDGRFMVQINLGKKPDGSRNRESKGFKDRISAEKYLSDRLAQLNGAIQHPLYQSTNMVQTSIYTDKTLEDYSMDILNRGIGKAGSRTIEGYRLSLIPVLERIGDIGITDIDDDQLIRLFNDLSYKYAKSSLKKSFITTKMIFEEAFAKEDIPTNPFKRLKCPESRKPVGFERKPYTDDEINRLLLAAKSYKNRIIYPILAILECTGMRPGELRALEWNDFDIETKTIHIKQAIVTGFDTIDDMRKKPHSFETVGKTKSLYGVRTLRLSDLAVSALTEWRAELDNMPSAMKNSKFIFPSQAGYFKSESSIKCIMQRFIKNSGLEDMNFMLYRFRHTMCTRLVLDNQPISVIQRILGDNTQEVIMRVYTHVSEQQALSACNGYYEKLNESHRVLYDKI